MFKCLKWVFLITVFMPFLHNIGTKFNFKYFLVIRSELNYVFSSFMKIY